MEEKVNHVSGNKSKWNLKNSMIALIFLTALVFLKLRIVESPLSFQETLLISSIISLALIGGFFILKKFMPKPIKDKINAHRDKVRKGYEERSDEDEEEEEEEYGIDMPALGWCMMIIVFTIIFMGVIDVKYDLNSNFEDSINDSMTNMGDVVGETFSRMFIILYHVGQNSPVKFYYIYWIVIFVFVYYLGFNQKIDFISKTIRSMLKGGKKKSK